LLEGFKITGVKEVEGGRNVVAKEDWYMY